MKTRRLFALKAIGSYMFSVAKQFLKEAKQNRYLK